MIAADIATALGGAYRCGGWWRCRCPSHGSRGATLALRDGGRALITFCHAGCSRAEILGELCRRGLLPGAAARLGSADSARDREAESRDRERRIALAQDMIRSALPAPDTPVERYLQTRTPGIAAVPPVIKFIPMTDPYARHGCGSCRPVMVAAVEHIGHGIVGAHRTWLAVDGSGKASLDPVRISTGPIKGGAVRLAPAAETLMVAEGIETAMAAMVATMQPSWAALSTSGLVALVLPPIVRTVIILADHDLSGAGERAARTAAARWLAEGRRVKLAMPPEPGTDFNDMLMGGPGTEMRDVAS